MFSHVCLFKDFPAPQDWQTDKNSLLPARPLEKNPSSKVLSLIRAKFTGWSRSEGEWVLSSDFAENSEISCQLTSTAMFLWAARIDSMEDLEIVQVLTESDSDNF